MLLMLNIPKTHLTYCCVRYRHMSRKDIYCIHSYIQSVSLSFHQRADVNELWRSHTLHCKWCTYLESLLIDPSTSCMLRVDLRWKDRELVVDSVHSRVAQNTALESGRRSPANQGAGAAHAIKYNTITLTHVIRGDHVFFLSLLSSAPSPPKKFR